MLIQLFLNAYNIEKRYMTFSYSSTIWHRIGCNID